uniref:Uncharacterized protein n=1 Tax=Anguilla anguilla TaxID=7936 RepID=A0A0E9PJZ1_ANGAN
MAFLTDSPAFLVNPEVVCLPSF